MNRKLIAMASASAVLTFADSSIISCRQRRGLTGTDEWPHDRTTKPLELLSAPMCVQRSCAKLSVEFCNLKVESRIIQRVPRFNTRNWRCLAVDQAVSSVETAGLVFPLFLPPDVELLKDPAARNIAAKIQQLPVQTSLSAQPIMTSCVEPKATGTCPAPVMLLHGFDSSVLEWRYTYPLLEDSGVESWAIDILGWGFSNAEGVKSYGVAAKREHLYEFWKAYVKRPMILVGPSLGGAVAIDFALAHPDAIAKLVLVNAQAYTEGVGEMATLPKLLAYMGVSVLKSVPVRFYANTLIFTGATYSFLLDAMRVGRLHTLMPGWADATVSFMLSGGYNVAASISQVQQETLVIWGEQDKIVSRTFAEKLVGDIANAKLEYIKDCGHIPHVEKPSIFAALLAEFVSQHH